MEIQREIRGFYIKLATPISPPPTPKIVEALWSLSFGVPISSIDINKDEIFIHSEGEFSFENWDASVKYLKSVISLLSKKYGYIIIRRVIASKTKLRTELEAYKITKRGVYLSELPNSPEIINDALRFSGRNKRLQFKEFIANIFKTMDDQDKEPDGHGF